MPPKQRRPRRKWKWSEEDARGFAMDYEGLTLRRQGGKARFVVTGRIHEFVPGRFKVVVERESDAVEFMYSPTVLEEMVVMTGQEDAIGLLRLPDPSDFTWRVPTRHYSADAREAVFFYGGPFSNFVGPPMLIRGPQFYDNEYLEYRSVEHYFQASKAVRRADHLEVVWAQGPMAAKFTGNRIELRDDWEDVKKRYMLRALRKKFEEEPYRSLLIGTGYRYLVEYTTHAKRPDREWGLVANARGRYTGNNYLGRLLIIVRAEKRHGMVWSDIPQGTRI